jgi:hypothetical protein
MTTTKSIAPAPPVDVPRDHRGSWVPTPGMVATRFMELRKRRGLMIALAAVNIGIPTLVLGIRLISHAVDPKSYGPAGGYGVYSALVAGVMYIFGFIVAAVVGCTAGTSDLTDGVFRHLVITGRSRLALYLARIPAGLAVVVPMVAVGFTIVCAVCVFAAPTKLSYTGVNVPSGLSKAGLETWAADHADEVICNFGFRGPPTVAVNCGNGQGPGPGAIIEKPNGTVIHLRSTAASVRAAAQAVAARDYANYKDTFLYPSVSLMVKSGLWLELEAAIGFLVGLGLASLLGQRTIAMVLMIVLELILTPLLGRANLPHFSNLQRSLVGLATAHLEPGGLPVALSGGGGGGGGGGPGSQGFLPESTTVAVCVIIAWIVGWTVIGAWRMATRDV